MSMQGVLNHSVLGSIVTGQSPLNPRSRKLKRNITADLLLTALIDAFSILVIFLLMNFSSTGEILFISKGMELPKAGLADTLERNLVLKVEGGRVFVENKEIPIANLVQELVAIRKHQQELADKTKMNTAQASGSDALTTATIQADRRAKYEELSPLVQALSHSGYSDIRFAVVLK